MVDFKLAIRQHVEWRFRLLNLFQGLNNETLQVELVSVDNRCILGQWIYSEGIELYGDNKYFQDLVEDHKKFHYALGDIVGKFHKGEEVDLQKELGLGGNFDKTSIEVVKDVLMLQKSMEKQDKESEVNN